MLQELAAHTGAAVWVIASMLVFLGVYVGVIVRVWRARPDDLEACSRLVFEGEAADRLDVSSDAPTAR